MNFRETIFYRCIKHLFDYKKPIIKNNTFLVWEPCSKSHSEVVPGYVKYLLDLGYHVSVLVNYGRIKDGLFLKFKHENLSINKMSKKQILNYFKQDDLKNVSGVLITTVGKLCDSIHYEDCYKTFNPNTDKSKLFFVEHEVKHSIDADTWNNDLITLRDINYKDKKSVVVNPHYFGDVTITSKNDKITNFVTVGSLQAKRKNNELIVNTVKSLHEKGYHNFKITVIGKGKLKYLPKELRQYFDIKGRLPFAKMYEELEKSDYMLTAYDEKNPKHLRYNTTGTSGNFQLVFGFLKPCVIIESFAKINGFNQENSILYKNDEDMTNAMIKAMSATPEEYAKMQNCLKQYKEELYHSSLKNFSDLIERKQQSR